MLFSPPPFFSLTLKFFLRLLTWYYDDPPFLMTLITVSYTPSPPPFFLFFPIVSVPSEVFPPPHGRNIVSRLSFSLVVFFPFHSPDRKKKEGFNFGLFSFFFIPRLKTWNPFFPIQIELKLFPFLFLRNDDNFSSPYSYPFRNRGRTYLSPASCKGSDFLAPVFFPCLFYCLSDGEPLIIFLQGCNIARNALFFSLFLFILNRTR